MCYIHIYCMCVHVNYSCAPMQSCWTMAVLVSWSQRRSCAAHVPRWSARATAATPPCTCAGTATPACPWWTSVSPWRYPQVSTHKRTSPVHTDQNLSIFRGKLLIWWRNNPASSLSGTLLTSRGERFVCYV